jgi:L-lactate utilization protein LutB
MDTIEVGNDTLASKVQSFRDKAREILRMKAINRIMQEKFNVSKEISGYPESLEDAKKNVLRVDYKLGKLDEENPDFEDMKKDLEDTKEYAIKNVDELTEMVAKKEKYIAETIAKLDEKIAAYESGEKKVSIDEVNALAEQMIMKA